MGALREGDAKPITFEPGPLRGEIIVPGDKSISHRALILGAALPQPLHIQNLNPGLDVEATQNALRLVGAHIKSEGTAAIVQPAPLHDARATIDCRNSGSTARMVLGACAGANLLARFDGDASLRRRPMEPVAAQLRAFGAKIKTHDGRLPLTIEGTPEVQTRRFILLSPSAQIKSALLFAAVYSRIPVTISNDARSRDHTERLLHALGADIRFNGTTIEYTPGELAPSPLRVPGDFSAAAFFIVGASIAPGSSILIRDVGVNSTRTGLLEALWQMGARISLSNRRDWNDEPVADIAVEGATLCAATIGSDVALRAIDEIPVLAVAAAHAQGTTRITGIRQLRDKESDRTSAIERLLGAVGVAIEMSTNEIQVGGLPAPGVRDRTTIEVRGDHRTAMSAAALAAAAGSLAIDDGAIMDVSFPGFSRVWASAQR